MMWRDLREATAVMERWMAVNEALGRLDMLPGAAVEIAVRRACYPSEPSVSFEFSQAEIRPLLNKRKAEIQEELDHLGVKP